MSSDESVMHSCWCCIHFCFLAHKI